MRLLLACVLMVVLAPAARAAVIVVGNFTPADVAFTVAEPGEKARTVTAPSYQVIPVPVAGPADVTFPTRPEKQTLRLDPYNAYVFIPDEKAGLRLEGLELPGDPPERDARAELNPAPRNVVRVPVTLLVDDADPRADKLWQDTVRKRFAAAAALLEATCGVRFEFAGFAQWKSDPAAADVPALLADFEAKVAVKPGRLAIGWTSRKVEEKEGSPFGACRGVTSRHVLVREWRPKAEPERAEVVTHYLGQVLGAVTSADPGSVMRTPLGDGRVLLPNFTARFDPLNALAMNLWADELRRGPVVRVEDADPLNKVRLARVYKAILKGTPGESLALTYLNEFDRDVGRPADVKKAEAKKPDPKDPAVAAAPARTAAVRKVLQAVRERAKANAGPGAVSGDELTAAYVRAAALAARDVDETHRASAFLLGVRIGLDDNPAAREDKLVGEVARAAETDAEAVERILALGNPTLRHRRDLCRRFAVGCAAGEELTPAQAETQAILRSGEGFQLPTGFSFPALAAELAGVAFGKAVRTDPGLVVRLGDKFAVADWLPDTAGLRDGVSAERFGQLYGEPPDARFGAVLEDIRGRIKALPGHKQ